MSLQPIASLVQALGNAHFLWTTKLFPRLTFRRCIDIHHVKSAEIKVSLSSTDWLTSENYENVRTIWPALRSTRNAKERNGSTHWAGSWHPVPSRYTLRCPFYSDTSSTSNLQSNEITVIILTHCYFYCANNLYHDHHHEFPNHPREGERDDFTTSQWLKSQNFSTNSKSHWM